MKQILAALWARWKILGQRLATFQARLLLSVFYYIVFAPFALALKTFSDPLRLRPASSDTWLERAPGDADNATLAKRQF